MDDVAATLHAAFLDAYRPTVVARLAAMGSVETAGLDEALAAGEEWLDEALRAVLAAPHREQRHSPLEVFREAMRFPTAALETAGVAPVERDPIARDALPGDLYGLAPASSQDLGQDAWRAHLAWGAAKARAVARPVVGLLSVDLMDRTRIESEATSAGFAVVMWADAVAVAEALHGRHPAVAFVDLTHGEADDAVRALAGRGVRVIGYGPHVDDFAMLRARSLGAEAALARSRFFRSIPDLLPTVV
jgi:hypothetical protein